MGLLGGVRQNALKQRNDVLVGEGIENVLRFPATLHQPGSVKNLQPGGDATQLGLLELDQFCHTSLALRQQDKEPQSRRIPQRVKHRARSFQLGGRRRNRRLAGRVVTAGGHLTHSIYSLME
nr:hypothetical protein [Burkholderia multivorans]